MSTSVRKIEPEAEPLNKLKSQSAEPPVFRVVRADTDLFATLDGLEMQTGVDRHVLRRLVLKELTDNALDDADAAGRGGRATIRKLGDHRYEITDEGNGLPGTPEDLAALFSIHRPMVSAKFWRLPSRGALGNGLRVIVGGLGLTPQKPLQRAYQRDPEAIEAWQRERYPAIARQAKASGGEVYFWDESGFRADGVHGKTWGKKGQTPVVERPGQRQSISAASAVNARGGFWYCTYQGGLH